MRFLYTKSEDVSRNSWGCSKAGWREEREGNTRRLFQTRAAGERVGMTPDKLPDPLPPRRSNNGVAEPLAGNGTHTSDTALPLG